MVEVGKATIRSIEDDAQAVGTLQARQGVMIRPEVSGRVVRLGFKDGQDVRRGQVLLQFDDALQRAQFRQAEAQAAIARTNLQRQRDLLAENFVSQSAVDQTAAALEVAVAQVSLARAQLDRMRVVAPFDGIAGITNIDLGDYVKDGADVVAVEDITSMVVDFRLPERFASRVRKGQSVAVTLDALPGQSFNGIVQALDAQIDANGRSLLVRATVSNSRRVLRTGMFARARVVFDTRAQAVVVPEEAIVPMGGKQFLIKLVEGEKGPTSQRIEAKIGVRLSGVAEVLDGVREGDQLVTAGHERLLARDGVPVRVVDVNRAGRQPPAAPGSGPGGKPSVPAAGSGTSPEPGKEASKDAAAGATPTQAPGQPRPGTASGAAPRG